jgi:hypothetical protein
MKFIIIGLIAIFGSLLNSKTKLELDFRTKGFMIAGVIVGILCMLLGLIELTK